MIGVITGIIIFALCVVFFFVGENTYRVGLSVISIIIGLFTAFYLFFAGALYVVAKVQIPEFQNKKAYIEETLGKEEKSLNESIDEQALQELKVSCNRWLIEAKTYHENLKMWLVIPDEVMDLTFIE
ncbi:hypothetical protein [Eubacterium callanderi]|uniref:hypothetical protein n=1 Tax=Eubacterium callanderi TaxID=53442 RepID=UPI001C1280A5|nr:hypothetical protein [Eubacterium callanderi]MBU5306086.1 hypothetical protein [Eubacterium callanderi]